MLFRSGVSGFVLDKEGGGGAKLKINVVIKFYLKASSAPASFVSLLLTVSECTSVLKASRKSKKPGAKKVKGWMGK